MSRVVKTPGVCGGRARVDGTRITVWLIVLMLREGQSMRDLAQAYPRLTVQDVEAAAAYERAHPEEIQNDIDGQEWS